MAYLLDTNVFIQAKNLHYAFDVCPGFWDWLVRRHGAGDVFSVQQVGDELAAGSDALATWAHTQGDAFFLPPDAESLPALTQVAQWVTTQGYEPAAVNTFLQVADYYLIAHAVAHGHTVVTHEVPAQTLRKVKIPNVCIGLGVPYVSTFLMLSRERARFVLAEEEDAI